MLTALGPYFWALFFIYVIAGWYLARNFPVKGHVERTFETIFVWPSIYGKHLKIIFKFQNTVNEPILKYYLMEEWGKLIERVPYWTSLHNGEQFLAFRVVPTKVFSKSIEFPPFIGYSVDAKVSRAEIIRISSHFSYEKDDFGNAMWKLPLGVSGDAIAYTGDVFLLDYNYKEHFVHKVIKLEDLKYYTPW